MRRSEPRSFFSSNKVGVLMQKEHMQVVTVKVEELNPAPYNPRKWKDN